MDRDEFMELVYETFADEPDNVLANGIIEAADAYVEYEKAQLSQQSTTSDLISRQDAIDEIKEIYEWHDNVTKERIIEHFARLPSAQPEKRTEERTETHACDLIDRQAAIDALEDMHCKSDEDGYVWIIRSDAWARIDALPSAQPEPLTDKEQRIFLAAMEREEKVCEEVDKNYVREPYEDSLMQVCKEIIRKVKGALWT